MQIIKTALCLTLIMLNIYVKGQTYLEPTLLRDINPTMNPFFTDLKTVGDEVFFFAADSIYNSMLWASDGTPEGTRVVKEINPGSNADVWTTQHDLSTSVIGMRDTTYFFAYRNDIGYELWKSAGHDSNTVLVKDINPGPGSALPISNTIVRIQPTLFQDKLYFVAFSPDLGYEVWRTDGSTEGTIPISAIPGNGTDLNPVYLQVVDDRLFFAVDTWSTTEPGAFFASDGTAEGTVQFSNLIPSHLTPSGSFNFYKVGEWIYFTARETGDGHDELYRVKSDLSVVELFYDFNGENEGNPENFTPANGGFILNARHNSFGDASNITLLCNGSINTAQSLLNANGEIMEIGGGLIGWNNRLLMEAGNDSLYVTDGTVGSLTNLGLAGEIGGLDLLGLSADFLVYGEYLIFIFSDDNYTYLMMTDGTAQGTFPLMNPENWKPLDDMALLGNKLIINLVDEQADPGYPELYSINLEDLPLGNSSTITSESGTLVYPNPSTGRFWLSNCKAGSEVVLRSLMGLELGRYIADKKGQIEIDAQLMSGIYLLCWSHPYKSKPCYSKVVLMR